MMWDRGTWRVFNLSIEMGDGTRSIGAADKAARRASEEHLTINETLLRHHAIST
jgi:hypothetical protein